jgi:hypothetical protein
VGTFIRRPLFWQLSLFLFIWCLIVEILIRTFLMSPSNVSDDAMLGWRYPPSSTFLTLTTDAGYRRVNVNAFGFNDDPIGPKDGRTRFIVLGDSYVEAFQVPRHRNFIHLIEHDMPRFQIINAGQSGLDPASELVVLDRLDEKLSPDGVILVLNSGDETDLLRDKIKVKHCPGSRAICDYQLPIQTAGAVKSWLKPAMARSALLTFLLRKYKEPVDETLAEFRHIVPRIDSAPYAAGGLEDLAPSDIENLLKLVFARIERRHPLIVVFLPALEFTVDRQTNMTGSENFAAEIARAAHDVGTSFLDARDALSEAYAKYGQPPTGFDFNVVGAGHLNELGHHALAKALETKLAKFRGLSAP